MAPIRYQSLLCISHLIIWRPVTIDELFASDIATFLMNVTGLQEDKQLLFYHSWLLSCMAGRFQAAQLECFLNRVNNPESSGKVK
jgi:hypothetical protein